MFGTLSQHFTASG